MACTPDQRVGGNRSFDLIFRLHGTRAFEQILGLSGQLAFGSFEVLTGHEDLRLDRSTHRQLAS